jgi:hypothetical protein
MQWSRQYRLRSSGDERYPGAMGRFNTSLALAKASWAVLKQDKQLAVIPVVSFFATIITAAAFGGVGYLTLTNKPATASTGRLFTDSSAGTTTLAPTPVTYVVGVVGYLAITFVVTFFAAALVSGAYERLTGGDPTLGSSFSRASKRLPQIFLWSMLAGTIGLLMSMLEERLGVIGSILVRGLDLAWRVVTWLAVPVIVAEGTGPIDSLKRSAKLFKQTWGENLIGQAGLGVVGLVVALPGVIVGIAIATLVPVAGIAIVVAWIIITSTIMAALNGIFRTALYLFAAGQPVAWFDQETMANAFRPKSSLLR